MYYIPTTERHALLFPTRVVKTAGNVQNAETLLSKRPPIPSQMEKIYARIEKTGEENPYIVLDFGKEIHGSLHIVTARFDRGCKNHKIRLVFGESVSEALSNIGKKGASNDHVQRDFEINLAFLSGADYGVTGFRFVKIELLEEGYIEISAAVAVSKTADFDQKGYVRTSNEKLNEILDTAIYTCYLNMQDGVIWDGIKRDRLVWSGDLNSEFSTLLYTYGGVENLRNSLDYLRDSTGENEWMNTIPSYSAWWIINQCLYYRIWGDKAYFLENVSRINSILRNLDLCIDADGADFDRIGVKAHMPYFLDWPTRDTDDAEPGSMLIMYLAAKSALESNAEGVDTKAASSLVEKLKRYLSAPVSMKQTVAIQAYCGGDADRKSVREKLEEGRAAGFSTFMSYFLLKGLSIAGSKMAVELACEYYGAMLSRGATTFWEDFDMDWLEGSGRIDEEPKAGERDLHADYGKYCYIGLRHSFCHGWSSGVVGWAFEELLGLKILEAGYRKISINPDFTEIDWIEAKIPTPMGEITVCAKRGEKPQITLPDGVELV